VGDVWGLLLVVPSGAVRAAGGGCLLAVVLGGGGGTGVGKGRNWEGAVRDYVHRRTQVATVRNTMTARVLQVMSVIRHRCQCLVKAASDLAQITVPNISK